MGRFVHTLSRVGRLVDEVEPLPPPTVRAGSRGEGRFLVPIVMTPRDAGGIAGESSDTSERGAGVSPAPSSESLDQVEPAPLLAEQSYWPRDPVTLPEVEDRRLFQPDRVRPLRRASSKPVRRLVAASVAQPNTAASDHPRIPAMAQALLCVRRKTRRGVLLALDRGGRNRKGVRSETSDLWCE